MAMPSGNIVVSDKMQFPVVGTGAMVASGIGGDVLGGAVVGSGGGGAEIHPGQWFAGEFIMWLRGEFAASNAIIDSLCHHLTSVGDPGEYDAVIASIQQRRCNWNPVLYMQQYFPIAEVTSSLQQVSWRRQQNRQFDPSMKSRGRDFKRGGGNGGFRQGHRMDGSYREWCVSNSGNRFSDETVTQLKKSDDKKDSIDKPNANGCLKSSGNPEEKVYSNSGSEAEEEVDGTNTKGSCNALCDDDSQAIQSQSEKLNLTITPKTFDVTENFEGKPVNIVEGLKLYQDLLDGSEVSRLLSLVHDLKAAGKKGQFQGQTFLSLKRPIRGHGRDVIQFGVPVSDLQPQDELMPILTCTERKIEAIPALLRDVLERLVSMQVTTVKPDSCIIDIYNEGDHSQPQVWPSSFGRPVCMMFLTECEISFGRVIGAEHPGTGNYKSPLKLSLSPGSLLVAQGRSADIAKHAIPSVRNQRILVTFTKSQPKETLPTDGLHTSSPGPTPSTHWGLQLIRQPHHVRHNQVANSFSPVPHTAGVLPALAARPQYAPPNGKQPIFMSPAVAPAMPFPASVALQPGTTWPVAPRHAPPRLPISGTGVFLPPSGPGNSLASQHVSSNHTDTAGHEETHVLLERENGSVKSVNNGYSPKGKKENGSPEIVDCNGSVDDCGSVKSSGNEEHQHSDEKNAFEN